VFEDDGQSNGCASLIGLVLAWCGPTLDQPFSLYFRLVCQGDPEGRGCEGEIESGAVRRYPT
jgi:hypothetical protein